MMKLLSIACVDDYVYEVALDIDGRADVSRFTVVPVGEYFIVQSPEHLQPPNIRWDASPICKLVQAFHDAQLSLRRT